MFAAYPFGPPQPVASVAVVPHVWKRNTLIGILSGTALHTVLVQVVFR